MREGGWVRTWVAVRAEMVGAGRGWRGILVGRGVLGLVMLVVLVLVLGGAFVDAIAIAIAIGFGVWWYSTVWYAMVWYPGS